MRHRARTANSFRAVWEPVALPAETSDPPHRLGGGGRRCIFCGAPAAPMPRRRRPNATVAVMPQRRRRPAGLWRDPGEIAHPVVDAAIAVRQRVHVDTWGQRLLTARARNAAVRAALAADHLAGVGRVCLPVPLVVMLLGFDLYWAWRSINMGFHTIKGYRAMKAASRVDWRQRYDAETRVIAR